MNIYTVILCDIIDRDDCRLSIPGPIRRDADVRPMCRFPRHHVKSTCFMSLAIQKDFWNCQFHPNHSEICWWCTYKQSYCCFQETYDKYIINIYKYQFHFEVKILPREVAWKDDILKTGHVFSLNLYTTRRSFIRVDSTKICWASRLGTSHPKLSAFTSRPGQVSGQVDSTGKWRFKTSPPFSEDVHIFPWKKRRKRTT